MAVNYGEVLVRFHAFQNPISLCCKLNRGNY